VKLNELTPTKFTSSNGRYYTKQLFWEEWVNLTVDQRTAEPLFSLYKDKPGMVNFGKRYVELRDPTGYKISQELLASYSHWQTLLSCRWFVTAKALWDKEMDAMLRSEAFQVIQELSETGLPAQRLAAAKYLANQEYRKDHTASKGRPKREDVDRAAKELAANDRDIAEDLKRIRKEA
jgi:hypothetical protein